MIDNKGINYIETLKRSLSMVWRNRYLWYLGLLAGSTGLNFGGSNPGTFSNIGSSGKGNPVSDEGIKVAMNWLQQNIVVVIVLSAIVILIVVAFAVLSLMARGGLVHAVDRVDENQKSSFKESMGFGWHKAWRVLGIGFLLTLLVLGIILPAVALFILLGIMKMWVIFVLLIIPFILLIFVFSIALGIVYEYALRFVVLSDNKAVESIKKGYALLKARKKESTLIFLTLLVVGIIAGMAIVFAMFIIIIPLVIIGVILALISKIALVIYAFLAIIFFLVLVFLAAGFLNSLNSAYWTLCFKEINSLEKSVEAS